MRTLAESLSILRSRRAKARIVMLIAYGDDSSDGTKSRVFAAASLVARQEEWDIFDLAWKARNGDRPFHAVDCETDHGDFAHTAHEDNKTLYADNVRLMVASKIMGAGVALSIVDYSIVFPSAPPGEWPYYMCFSGALSCVSMIGRVSIPPDRVRVTFDQNRDRAHDSRSLYDFMVHQSGWTPSSMLDDTIAFCDHRYSIGLQAADLLAYETMKELDNRLDPNRRWTRQSLIDLRKSHRFECIWYDRVKLEEHRAAADRLHIDADRGRAYRQWLGAKNISDSIQARLRFIERDRDMPQ